MVIEEENLLKDFVEEFRYYFMTVSCESSAKKNELGSL